MKVRGWAVVYIGIAALSAAGLIHIGWDMCLAIAGGGLTFAGLLQELCD